MDKKKRGSDLESFRLFCRVHDEFKKQSTGRIILMGQADGSAILETVDAPLAIAILLEDWLEEFITKPSFHFYRGNFFWVVSVSKDKLLASIIEKRTKGTSPASRTFSWPIAIAKPESVVKNMLDIMKNYERSHGAKSGKTTGSAQEKIGG